LTVPLHFETWVADGVRTYRHVADGPRPDAALFAYLELIWRLTEGRARYGVLRYWREEAEGALGEPFALVDWEHEVENEESGDLGTVRGYVPARSLGKPEAGVYALPEAALHALGDFETLRRLVDPLPSDATAELNLYALDPPDVPGALAALRSDDPPRLADLLGSNGVLVDLALAVDLGYRDVLVVQSRRDLANELGSLARQYAL
jgi:hypothetical protein